MPAPPQTLPYLPLVCLKTAKCSGTLSEEFLGKTTVIDFWTTKCTRCPDALDKLNGMAADPRFASVRFVSICCDSCDGAREIFEEAAEPRWDNLSHYFMEQRDKEVAKRVLGFQTVPFYVVVNERGEITQSGPPKRVDLDALAAADAHDRTVLMEGVSAGGAAAPAPVLVEREFCMDDDF